VLFRRPVEKGLYFAHRTGKTKKKGELYYNIKNIPEVHLEGKITYGEGID